MGGSAGGNGRVRPGRQQRCRSMRGYVGSGSRCYAGTLDCEPIRTSWRMLSSGPRPVVVSTTTGGASRPLVLRPGRCGVVGDRDDAAGSAVGCCAPGVRCARGIRRQCWRCRPDSGLLPDSGPLTGRYGTAGIPRRPGGTGPASAPPKQLGERWRFQLGPGRKSTANIFAKRPAVRPFWIVGRTTAAPGAPARAESSLEPDPARDKLGRERSTRWREDGVQHPPRRDAPASLSGGVSPVLSLCARSDSGWTLTDEKIQ